MGQLAKRIWEGLKVAALIVTNRYEAAYQRWGERSILQSTVQDARFDADESTRTELVRRSRYWEANNAIVNRLADLFEQFTVGPRGLQMVPNSSDEGWNQTASDWWAQWCKFADLTSLQPFGTLQSLMARSWFIDGEVFVYKCYSPDSNRPRVQVIESHRIATPPDKREQEGKTIIDGIKIDPRTGRPLGYYMRDSMDQKSFVLVDAKFIIHIFEPSRPGQMRGLPFLYPVMNDLHDLDDLQKLEMDAAKAAAAVTNVITTASGEISQAGTRRTRMSIGGQDANGNNTTKPDDQFYQVVLGGRTVVLKKGEDMKQFMSDRPNVTTREYWDYLTAKVCAGVGISRLLVFPYSMQGTVTRADLDVATVFFRSRSEVIAAAVKEVYQWVMGYATTYDPALDGFPKDWNKVTARPPRAPNVDVGRNSAAMLAELEAGTRTLEDIYAEAGYDWRERITQKAQERAFIHKTAIQYGVDPNEIASIQLPKDPNAEPTPKEPATA